jgi:hypothetical protein
VVRSAKLKLSALAVLVAAGHFVALEWIGRQADAISGMAVMVPPMYTRLLQPATPPVVVPVAAAPAAVPKPRAAPRPKPPASSAEELRRKKAQEEAARRQAEELARRQAQEEQLAAEAVQAAEEAARAEQLAREEALAAAAAAASAPASAASAAAAATDTESALLARWPTDTRLTYRLSGEFRNGPLYGDARVQWQRDGGKYQVRLDVKIQVFGTQTLTSQGDVTPEGLLPRAYEEMRPGKRRFAQIGDEVVVLENGRTLPRPAGVQDTASQFVELSHRFATGKDVLEVGRTVSVWLARPGAMDRWTYDIVARDVLRTPHLGDVEAFHLKPRPIANPRGNYTAEMWFAPSLQYLPVRIKVLMGTEAYLDLLVDHIEQR